MREMKTLEQVNFSNNQYTALLYCPPGVGKSTAIGLIAEASEGKTLVLDVDRTIGKTLAKHEVVKDTSRVLIWQVDVIKTFADWTDCLKELVAMRDNGQLKEMGITTIAVDNISELERCILSDLGRQGKNKDIPAQADYQYMQFKLVNSLRLMKTLGVNVVWTAWQDVRNIVNIDGTQYTQLIPKINQRIVDNICGLCDVVGKIIINKEGRHGILLAATPTTYAKNQIDDRKACKVEDFVNFSSEKEDKDGDEADVQSDS